MSLTRIIYYSVRDASVPLDVSCLLAQCHKANAHERITGFLYYSGTYFIQVLEGSRTGVNELYHRIAADKRHTRLMILQCADVHERRFPNWTMGFQDGMDDCLEDLFLRYFASTHLDSATVNVDSLLLLLRDLATESADRALAALMAKDAANNAPRVNA